MRRSPRNPDACWPRCRAAAQAVSASSVMMRRRRGLPERLRACIRAGGSSRPGWTRPCEVRAQFARLTQKPMTSVRARALASAREDGERVARNGAVVAGALERRLDGVVLLHQARWRARDRRPRCCRSLSVRFQKARSSVAAAAEAQDDGQRDLALAEIIADRLAEPGAVARIVERVVDELEGDAEVAAVRLERAPAPPRDDWRWRRPPRRPPRTGRRSWRR